MRNIPNTKRQQFEARLTNAKALWRSASEQQKEDAVLELFDLVQSLIDRAFPDYILPDDTPSESN